MAQRLVSNRSPGCGLFMTDTSGGANSRNASKHPPIKIKMERDEKSLAIEAALKNEIEAQKKCIAMLEQKVTSLSADFDANTQARYDAEHDLAQARAEVERLSESGDAAKEMLVDLGKKVRELSLELDHVRAEKERAKADLEKERGLSARLRQQLQHAEAASGDADSEWKQTVDQLVQENIRLETDLDGTKEKLVALEQDFAALAASSGSLATELEREREEREDADAKLLLLEEEAQDREKKLKEQIRTLTADKARCMAMLRKYEAGIVNGSAATSRKNTPRASPLKVGSNANAAGGVGCTSTASATGEPREQLGSRPVGGAGQAQEDKNHARSMDPVAAYLSATAAAVQAAEDSLTNKSSEGKNKAPSSIDLQCAASQHLPPAPQLLAATPTATPAQPPHHHQQTSASQSTTLVPLVAAGAVPLKVASHVPLAVPKKAATAGRVVRLDAKRMEAAAAADPLSHPAGVRAVGSAAKTTRATTSTAPPLAPINRPPPVGVADQSLCTEPSFHTAANTYEKLLQTNKRITGNSIAAPAAAASTAKNKMRTSTSSTTTRAASGRIPGPPGPGGGSLLIAAQPQQAGTTAAPGGVQALLKGGKPTGKSLQQTDSLNKPTSSVTKSVPPNASYSKMNNLENWQFEDGAPEMEDAGGVEAHQAEVEQLPDHDLGHVSSDDEGGATLVPMEAG